MKKVLLAAVLVLVICTAFVLVACNGGSEEVEYTVKFETDCADGVSVNICSGEAGKAEYKVSEGSTLDVHVAITKGYSADNMVVKFNDTVLSTGNFSKDEYYHYTTQININADGVVSVKGVAVKDYHVELPEGNKYPSGISAVLIDKILKKDAAEPVDYVADTKICYGDSIRVKVIPQDGKSLLAGIINQSDIGLGEYFNNMPMPTESMESDDEGNSYFYFNNIERDLTLCFHKGNAVVTESTEIYDRQYYISAGDKYFGYGLKPYDPENPAAPLENSELNNIVSAGDTVNFTVVAKDTVDISAVTFVFNGEPLATTAHEEGAVTYYSFIPTEDGIITASGVKLKEGAATDKFVFFVDDSINSGIDNINMQGKALFRNKDGYLVYLVDKNGGFTFDGNMDGYPGACSIEKIDVFFGTKSESDVSYPKSPVVSLDEMTGDNDVEYKINEQENYQQINFVFAYDSDSGNWSINYEIMGYTNELGSYLLYTSASPISVTSGNCYLLFNYVTEDIYSNLQFKKVTIDDKNNESAESDLSADSKVTFTHDAEDSVLTIKSTDYDFEIKIDNVIKDGTSYKIKKGTTYDVYTAEPLVYAKSTGIIIKVRPDMGVAGSLESEKDVWGRFVKVDGAYVVTDNEANGDILDIIVTIQ